MSKKTKPVANIKLEASAKASFQRSKRITEIVPEDVTRAKAGAWLDLISPVTEWAGLKGDALKFHRQQLRIQQEESLFAMAHALRRKIANNEIIKPIPRKILVPALEKASLEQADDETMIELWANLLASASMGQEIEPRYVGIIGELSGSQAKSLSAIATHRFHEISAPHSAFKYGRWEVQEREVEEQLKNIIARYLGELPNHNVQVDRNKLTELELEFSKWANDFGAPGIYLQFFSFWNFEYNTRIGEGLDIPEKDFEILESLSLIKRIDIGLDFETSDKYLLCSGQYCYLTGLGVDFFSVCAPDLVLAFQARENEQKS